MMAVRGSRLPAMSQSVPSLEALNALPRVQQPSYPDPQATGEVIEQLRALPPLVPPISKENSVCCCPWQSS